MRSLASTLGAALATVACGGVHAPDYGSVSSLPDEPRRARGVALDAPSDLPPVSPEAQTAEGVVLLTSPLDAAAARAAVREFFRAVVDESLEHMIAVLDPMAWLTTPTNGRMPALVLWRSRLSTFDYGALSGQTVFREADMQTVRASDVARLAPERRPRVALGPTDLVVRVAVLRPRAGKVRLFGDQLDFLLRPGQDGYKIVEMVEDFQLP